MNLDLEKFKNLLATIPKILDWGYIDQTKPHSYDQFLQWVDHGHSGILNYLTDHRLNQRRDIKELYPKAKSVLVFLFSYQEAAKKMTFSPAKKIASYVLGFEGFDYHHWIRKQLSVIQDWLQEFNIVSHQAIDTKAILERDFAWQAGLGWIGKNSMLINQTHGSYFLIALLILEETIDNFSLKKQETDHCGSCTRCAESCPTQAIDLKTRTIIANQCISTFTIELFKPSMSPPKGMEKTDYVFGCDICQDICPWNKKSLQKIDEMSSNNLTNLIEETINEPNKIHELSNRAFREKFKMTSLARTGRVGLLKNYKNFSFFKK